MTIDRSHSGGPQTSVEAAAFVASRPPVNRLGYLGAGILVAWALAALFAPMIAPNRLDTILSTDSFAGPGEAGILGSDYLGRDVFSRLIYGARLTLGIALTSTLLALVAGASAGILAAISGGVLDAVVSRVNDVFLSIPSIMLALIVVTALGSSIAVLVPTIAVIEATRIFRIARAAALDVYAMEFVEISRARGESRLWIMVRDILPNVTAVLLTDFGIRLNYAILIIASLSFLGLGIQPPDADWGMMVRENLAGINYGASATLAPAFAIFTLNVGINLVVEWNVSRLSGGLTDDAPR